MWEWSDEQPLVEHVDSTEFRGNPSECGEPCTVAVSGELYKTTTPTWKYHYRYSDWSRNMQIRRACSLIIRF